MFSEELAKYDWEETTRQIQHKRPADVETALGKEHLTLDDFMALTPLQRPPTWNRWPG